MRILGVVAVAALSYCCYSAVAVDEVVLSVSAHYLGQHYVAPLYRCAATEAPGQVGVYQWMDFRCVVSEAEVAY